MLGPHPAPFVPTLRARLRFARSWALRSARHATPRHAGSALARPWGAAQTVGTHTARSCHSVLFLLGQPPTAEGTASSDRPPAADPPRSTSDGLGRAGRRGAQGLHSSPVRSPQGDAQSVSPISHALRVGGRSGARASLSASTASARAQCIHTKGDVVCPEPGVALLEQTDRAIPLHTTIFPRSQGLSR